MFGLFSKDTTQKIGLFQLENLAMSQANFLFFTVGQGVDSRLDPYLQRAQNLAEQQVLETLKGYPSAETTPVILYAESMKVAVRLAGKLGKMGFINCYVVDLNFENQ